VGGTQNVSFLGRRYFKLPILSCPRIPPATQATLQVTKVLSTEEAKRAIEGSGKDFGKSSMRQANYSISSYSKYCFII
jgi:hypothetical protein